MRDVLIFFIAVTLGVTLLLRCKKTEFEIENLNGNQITVLGHGGMGVKSTYPMNSIESVLKCLALGANGSELDIQMTKDKVLILFHDEKLSDKTHLQGIVNNLSWDEIKNAYYKETPYLNYTLVSLEQLLSQIKNIQAYTFTFDCKLYTNQEDRDKYYIDYCDALIHIIEKHQLENTVCIESQDETFLNYLKQQRPNYKLFIYPSSFESGFNVALNLNLFGITISTKDITKEQIKLAHQNNLRVAIWNIHSASDNKEAIRKNPDYIQADNLQNLLNLLKK